MGDQEQAEAIRVLVEQEESLQAIAQQAERAEDYSLGAARLDIWIIKTKQLITEHIGEGAGRKFAVRPVVVNALYPDRAFTYKVREYGSLLTALRQSIQEDGLRFFRQQAEPLPMLRLAAPSPSTEKGDVMDTPNRSALAAITQRLQELIEIENAFTKDGDFTVARYRLKRWKARAVVTLRQHATPDDVEEFENDINAESFVEDSLSAGKGFLQALVEELDASSSQVTANKQGATEKVNTLRAKPRMFIGSSGEGLELAQLVQLALSHNVECVLWNQGAFGLSKGNLESLVKAKDSFNYAVLVLTPDDLTTKRGQEANSPRDNVLFELGLFMGALGRERTFMLYCADDKLSLPSDLAGVTAATFRRHSDGNMQAALGPACTQIMLAIREVEGRQ